MDEDFPVLEIENLGYNIVTLGQKNNGVAILSKFKIEETIKGLPDFSDEQSATLKA